MGKSSQVAMDHDSSSDRITARVGSRTKKAKIVFDPSDHHVPRKRNRRGENEPTTAGTGTPKSEPTRTATPLSSSSNEGSTCNNHSSVSTASTGVGGQRGTTALCRVCQKCGRSGPGRMPRKSPITPWTCSGCLIPKTASKAGSAGSKQAQSKMLSKSSRDRTSEEEAATDEVNDEEVEEEEEEEEEEEDNKQQHDFAGFSETELGGHGNESDVNKVDQKLYVREPHEDSDGAQNKPRKSAVAAVKRSDSHDGEEGDESAKDVRYWSCDDVCRFFSRHCKLWGDLFHEQEIDGASLLLMRKVDVLSRFGLKLGPAMELYQRIVALQNGDRDIVDVRLTWI